GGGAGRLGGGWAAPRAVVATARGVSGLAARDGENVLIADDVETFARHVSRLLGDAALRQRLAANGRATAEARYDWDAIAAAHAERYARVPAPRAAGKTRPPSSPPPSRAPSSRGPPPSHAAASPTPRSPRPCT